GFMDHHSVPVGELVLPIKLPFGQGMLFEQMVSFDDNHRGGSLKPYPTFDSYDGISYVNIPADRVILSDLLQCFDRVDSRCKVMTVDPGEFPLIEMEDHIPAILVFQLAWIGFFR